jgi:hypothetical protein
VTKPLDSISDLIAALGGETAMAKTLGVNTSTVYRFKDMRKIPLKYAKPILDALGDEYDMPVGLFNYHGRRKG